MNKVAAPSAIALPLESDRPPGKLDAPAAYVDRERKQFSDERMDERRPRLVIHLLRRAGLLDAAPVEDDNPVGDFKRLFLIVRDENRGDLNFVVEVAEPAPQFLAHLGIERAERFVEQ